jgi:hypothetical protein
MKFDKAYCVETQSAITPYLARELYFDENSPYYERKLSFKCEYEKCRIELVGVNIYSERRPKKALHFRTKPHLEHDPNCEFYNQKHGSETNRTSKSKDEEAFKISKYPSVFLLERPKTSNNDKTTIEIEIDGENKTVINKGGTNGNNPLNKKTELQTSCLDNIVDCFLPGNKKQLSNSKLTIGNKTKYYKNFFKPILFYTDEEGLIYWGKVKDIKPYGKNYRTLFKDRPKIGENNFTVSIYIEEKVIQQYRKKKMFRNQLDGLRTRESSDNVLCFFVGSYPKLTEIRKDDGTVFSVLDVKIENLDHIAFTFS